jgi:hypothetical protein
MLPNFPKSRICLEWFPGGTSLSFWKKQHIDEDEYGALVE